MNNKKVILIMTDTQRWDMVSCYRDTGLKTPNIDALAAEGIRFDRAYTTQPVCQAARAGLFTGQYPHSVAGWSNCMGISDNVHTIGERLQDHGVHTAYIGKWHLDGGDYFGLGRAPKGWDANYWYDMRNYLDELTEQERIDSRKGALLDERDFADEFTFGHRVTKRAVDFLEKFANEDFFLTVSYDEPHDPAICPPPYAHMYDDYCFPKSENVYDLLENKPDYQKVWAGDKLTEDKDALQLKMSHFFGCNSYVDELIGRVIAAAHKYAPDALILYTSDHGDMMSSHCLFSKGPACYDEITRIPFIAAGPGLPKGVVDSNPVSHINIAPTIMEVMGLPVPMVYEGKSIKAELEDPTQRVNDHIFYEFGRYEVDHDGFGGYQPMRTVFDGRYKLTINLMSTDELYDVETDPGEMVNLIDSAAHIAIRNALHDALLDNMNNTRDPFRGYYWERRPWRADARPATWDYTLMTRQRPEEDYEPRQLDYATGMPITEYVRVK